jgi:integrase
MMRVDRRHLEQHGRQWRVRVKVPAALRLTLGKAALVAPLHTDSLARANLLKWEVVARLKSEIEQARQTVAARSAGGDPVVVEGMEWRDAIAAEAAYADEPVLPDLAIDRAEELERQHGFEKARAFVAVATGAATPLAALVDAWLSEANYSGRTETARRQAVRRLLAWCQAAHISAVVETVDRKVAGRFVSEVFVAKGIDPATANKLITGLSAFWRWLIKRGHATINPWERQSLKLKKVLTEDGENAKRPFTDSEVATIVSGAQGHLADLCRLGALSGMRLGEMAELRVRNVRGSVMRVVQGKTDAATRDVPIHPAISAMIAARCAGKNPDAFVFHELPLQRSRARSRGAPVSQAFTRLLRGLGLDDRLEGRRQARTDFHSFRRWFIRKAVDALEAGATGFTAWTIADVVGHSNEAGPLGKTMGRYPGAAPTEARRACVEAVTLPDTA